MLSIFPIKVEGQRKCDDGPPFEAFHRSRGVIVGVTTDAPDPLPYNPEVITSLSYVGNVKIRERSELLKRRMKC